MAVLFTLTLFVSAFLLFLVQPMLARMVLPLLGGTPAVWNTCMVFFQRFSPGGVCIRSCCARMAGRVDSRPGTSASCCCRYWRCRSPCQPRGLSPDTGNPVPALFSATSRYGWFALFRHLNNRPAAAALVRGHRASPGARSLFSLRRQQPGQHDCPSWLPVPVRTTLRPVPANQALGHRLCRACRADRRLVLCLRRLPAPAVEAETIAPTPATAFAAEPSPEAASDPFAEQAISKVPEVNITDEPGAAASEDMQENPLSASTELPTVVPLDGRVTALRRLRWVVLAFVPSSLMLSVTTYLTTDIASIPLLWVLPLSLYLLTFILVFSRYQILPASAVLRWMPLVVELVLIMLLSKGTEPPVNLLIAIHLLGLFWISMACHGLLAADRPAIGHLTEFYLWMSFGGVLGGLFNALLAPLIFNSIMEYPIVLVLACLLRPSPAVSFHGKTARRWLDLAAPVALGLLTAGIIFGCQAAGVPPGRLSVALMFAAPIVLCYTFAERPVRFWPRGSGGPIGE